MISKSIRRMISMVLVLLIACQGVVFASTNDYKGHWAEDSIQTWIEKGYIKGYEDGSFKPENKITRAEFITIVNRSFEFTEEAEVNYKDVKESHWAYNEFKKASAAGYIGGFEDGTLRPNNQITRQETAAIIARLLKLKEAKDSKAFLGLNDYEAIPEWSAGVVSAIVDKGYMKLRDDNFAPALAATRAEVIDALSNGYLNFVKVKYDKAGTYTANLVDGSVEINVKDVILEDTIINGNLIIGEGVGSGDVTLRNVTVKGDTIVKGGGMNSIIIEDSKITHLIIEKKDGKIRILARGSSYIDSVDMQSGGKLESSDNNYGYIVIAEDVSSDEAIILVGNFESVEVRSGSNEIQVQSGTIGNLDISKTAKGAKVNLAKGAKIEQLEVNASARIEGKGEIKNATVNESDVTLIEPTGTLKKAEGKVNIETIKSGANINTGGGGGGSTPPSKVLVSAITVTSENDVTTVVNRKTLQLGVTVEPDKATNKSVTWSVTTLEDGTATIDANGVLTATGVGTVTVTAVAKDGSKVEGTKVITIELNLIDYNDALAAVVEADYTKGSWMSYQSVVVNNMVGVENTQARVDQATGNITAAQARLVTKVAENLAIAKVAAGEVEGDETTYTIISWQALTDALAMAEGTNQEKIDKTSAINSAVAGLVEKADLSDYNAALVLVTEAVYTEKSWATYQGVIVDNKVTVENTQTEVDAATQNIIAAQDDLVTKVDAALTAAKLVANGKAEADYTTVTWQALTNALAMDEGTDQEKIAKTTAINSAIEVLIEKADLNAYNQALLAVVEADHTEASWATYQLVVSANKVTGENTQADVDAATENITTAQEDMVLKVDENLANAKVAAGEVEGNETTYTIISWQALTDALAMDEETDQEKISKTDAINNAVDGLVFIFEFDNETGTITGYNGASKEVVIPNKINGIAVVTIGDYAFFGNELTTVEIPSSVTSVGKGSFNNNKLPNEQAFIYARKADGTEDKTTLASYGGANREEILIPETVTTIGNYAFNGCSLTEIEIGNSVVTIGDNSFSENNLTKVIIPDSVKTIGSSAFSKSGFGGYGNIETKPYAGTWIVKGDPMVWTKVYTVDFSAGDNGSLAAIVNDEVIEIGAMVATGKDVVFTATPDTGYQVASWTIGGEVVDNTTNTLTILDLKADTVVVVEFEVTAVTGVTLDENTLNLAASGDTGKLIATVIPVGAFNQSLTWASSNEDIATIDEDGIVTPLKAGTATITVITVDGGKTATCEVTVNKFSGGTGVIEDPYLVANAQQLNYVRDYLDGHFKQIADIDIFDWKADGGWVPIGGFVAEKDYTKAFKGNYDGDIWGISGLTINRNTSDHQGLFGYISEGAVLNNIDLTGANITGKQHVGGLVGRNYMGTISNSHSSGSIQGAWRSYCVGGLVGRNHKGTISNSYSSGSVNGGQGVGGLIGYNEDSDGTIEYCYASASVEGEIYVGGLIGENSGTINNSYATGDVKGGSQSGGLVGRSLSTLMKINNSYATGSVTGSGKVGGLIGYFYGNISNSYATGPVTGSGEIGGLVGEVGSTNTGAVTNSYYDLQTTGQSDNDSKGEPKTPAEMGKQITFDGDDKAEADRWNFTDTWLIQEGHYPYLKWQPEDFTPVEVPVTIINIQAIQGVVAPVNAEISVSTITETDQYKGTITWNPSDTMFGPETAYTATITLTAKDGYTLEGVAEDFFTVGGAEPVTNVANTGVITAVFPPTAPNTVIEIATIQGVTVPVNTETPVGTIVETDQYTGTISWNPSDAIFGPETDYTATITLTAKDGYTLEGVAENFFTVNGATANNDANSGVITALFPATASNQKQDAPTGLVGVAPTSVANDDGKIENVTHAMECKLSTDGEWMPVVTDATVITGLAAGIYEVRLAAKTGFNAGTSVAVVVGEYVIPVTYMVTFNSNGGTNVDAIEIEDGETITLPENPTKAEFTFEGWFIDKELTEEFTAATEVIADVIVYAKWTEEASASTDATLTSTIGTVDDSAETIVDVPNATTLVDFKAAITPATDATFEVYNADGTTVATDLADGYKIIVTAEDGTTTKTYTVTVEEADVTIEGYFLDNDGTDTALVTTTTVANETEEGAALEGLSAAGFAKLSDNSYVAITITWVFDETYVGADAGAKAVTGTVSGTFDGEQVPRNQTGTVTVE